MCVVDSLYCNTLLPWQCTSVCTMNIITSLLLSPSSQLPPISNDYP